MTKIQPATEEFHGKWWVLLAVGVGTFMSALDGSIVNTILPVLSREFGVGVATVEWVVVSYLLTVTGLLLSLGRLGDMLGHRRVYNSGFGIFIVSSIICATAGDIWILVGGRALQAVGTAMLFATGPALLTLSFPGRQRGQALGLQATMTYLGLTFGPTAGGWLAHHLSWHAVFYINVPIGLLALSLSLRHLPANTGGKRGETFDIAGALLFTGGLMSSLLALNRGHDWGWFSAGVLAFGLAGIGLLCCFVVWERVVAHPMLNLKLFRSRTFSLSVVSALLNYMCAASMMFVLPFLLIQGRGMTPAAAGMLLSVQPLVMAMTAPFSGTLSDRIGSRIPTTLGMGLMAAALLTLTLVNPGSSTVRIALSLALAGLGAGLFTSPNNSALMGSAPRGSQGVAAGLLALARNTGMVLGVGLAGAVFTTALSHLPDVQQSLYPASHYSFFAGAVLAVAGTFTSSIRGNGI